MAASGGVKTALVALSLVFFAVSAMSGGAPSQEECQVFIERERQQCQQALSPPAATGPLAWLSDILFAEARYMKEREAAMAARERDLIRLKVQRGELPPEALDQPLPSQKESAASKGSLLVRIWNELFAEARYMRERNEAIAAREADLRRIKMERGEAVEPLPTTTAAPQVEPLPVDKKPMVAAASWTVSAERPPIPSSGNWLYDILFAEVHYMKMRDQAIADRQRDLIRVKVERGELPTSALDNLDALTTPETQGRRLGLWEMIFSERRLLRLRRQAMAARARDLVRLKVERGELPAEALERADEQLENESTEPQRTGLASRLYDAVFSEARHMELRRRALAERHYNLVRAKVERGELPTEALEAAKQYEPAEAAPKKSILSRIWAELFAESRYMADRNRAIAEREADLRRVKEALARGEVPQKVEQAAEQKSSDKDVTDRDSDRPTAGRQVRREEDADGDVDDEVTVETDTEGEDMTPAREDSDVSDTEQEPEDGGYEQEEEEEDAAAASEEEESAEEDEGETKEREEIDGTEGEAEAGQGQVDDGKGDDGGESAKDDDEHDESDDDYDDDGERDTTDITRGQEGDMSKEEDEDEDDEENDSTDRTPDKKDVSEDEGEGEDADDRQEDKEHAEEDTQTSEPTPKATTAESIEPVAETSHLRQQISPAGQREEASASPVPAPDVPTRPEAQAHVPAPAPVPVPAPQPVPAAVPAPAPVPVAAPAVQVPAPPPPAPVSLPQAEEYVRPTARPRHEVEELLGLTAPFSRPLEDATNYALRELKKIADSAIKPLEETYKYNAISSRSLGDAEIFSKPMILFLGQLNSGKSTMINYLLGTEATRTTALPGSGQFRILTYGDREEKQDGAQVTAHWEFSGLQKFGETFLDRLSGRQLRNKLLEKVNIVDVPGIMEGRQYGRLYPFNDVCQWFIDRADIIFVVFDPHHLDIGLEMENLLDQLKGRESQVRIILNKADQLPAADLLKVQGGLIWSLSPLLGSTTPPPIFSGSFINQPYMEGAPVQLFRSQEDNILKDIADGLSRRVENRIGLARRHAVRVRNHARMVDCYLTTFYNQQTFLSNKKKLAEDVVSNPHKYHIYEGISRVTNISRYDLPDPEVYEDFFTVHPLYDFPTLASTCTYFKGCPLDKLDIAISYDLPELLGKYRKMVNRGAGRHRG